MNILDKSSIIRALFESALILIQGGVIMFKYAKEEISDKINELEDRRNLIKLDQRDCLNKIIDIEFGIYFHKETAKRNTLFTIGLVLGIIGLASCGIAMIGLFNISLWIPGMITMGSMAVALWNKKEITYLKKLMKNRYGKNLNNTELSNMLENLRIKNNSMEEEKTKIQNEICSYEQELNRIKTIEDGMRDIENPYYIADTQEEFEILNDWKSKQDDLFLSYLDEKIDYPKIYFNSDIDNSKKLVKKK